MGRESWQEEISNLVLSWFDCMLINYLVIIREKEKLFPSNILMNKEKNQIGKNTIQSRGRWSVRLNNELLDLTQKNDNNWESISEKLGFDVNVLLQFDYYYRNVNSNTISSFILRSMKIRVYPRLFQRKLLKKIKTVSNCLIYINTRR